MKLFSQRLWNLSYYDYYQWSLRGYEKRKWWNWYAAPLGNAIAVWTPRCDCRCFDQLYLRPRYPSWVPESRYSPVEMEVNQRQILRDLASVYSRNDLEIGVSRSGWRTEIGPAYEDRIIRVEFLRWDWRHSLRWSSNWGNYPNCGSTVSTQPVTLSHQRKVRGSLQCDWAGIAVAAGGIRESWEVNRSATHRSAYPIWPEMLREVGYCVENYSAT